MRRTGYGITLDVPAGWSHRSQRRRPDDPAPEPAPGDDPTEPPRGREALVERTMPVVHVCSRELPPTVGDFGQGGIELLSGDDVLVALVEYGSDLADVGLFRRRGRPRLAPSQFSPDRMPRQVPGRSASQHFFSEGGRAFCLYTVIGSHSRRMRTVPRAAAVVDSLRVETAAAMRARGVDV